MAKGQIGIRFDSALLTDVDEAAKALGWTRTEYIEQACRRAIADAKTYSPQPAPSRTVHLGKPPLGPKRGLAPSQIARKASQKRSSAPHSVATANRSAAGSQPLERREVEPIPKAPKGKR